MKLYLLLFLVAFLATASHVLSEEEPSEKNEIDTAEPNTELAESGADPSEDDVPESASKKTEKMLKAAKTLSLITATLVGLASGPVGAAASIGITVVFFIIDALKEKNTDIWKQLEDKVELKIGEKLAKYHVERLYNEVFKVFERRFKDESKFGADDLDLILDKSYIVFPQGWTSVGWSYDLPLAILHWMPFMIAGYHHMINKNEQPVCALANELTRTRARIITGMKEMTRKRYAQMHATSYSTDRVNYDCNKKKNKKRRLGFGNGEKVCVSIDRLMTYQDGLSDRSFTIRKRHLGWIGDNWDTNINKIRDNTVDFLWKEVIEKVNKYFDSDVCLESLGCTCPPKIKKSDISFNYPRSCFGGSQCIHPCGRFGYNYDWCYINRNPDQWEYCSRINYEDCMKVTVPSIELPNVLPIKKGNEESD